MKITEKKFTELCSEFNTDLKTAKLLLIKNGFVKIEKKEITLTKTGKKLRTLVNKERKKK